MKIRAQLSWLMVAVVAPLLALAGASTYALFETQRQVHSQRFLERVRALQLALDTELRGTQRLLRVFAERGSLTGEPPPSPEGLADSLQRVLNQHPGWSSIAVIEADGRVTARLQRAGAAPTPALDERTRMRVLESRGPAVSDLVSGADGQSHATFLAVPALAAGKVVRIVSIAIDHREWLAFLRSYPIAQDATLTLNDSQGLIIARTLNNPRWAGKPLRADYWQRVASGPREATFVSVGLEGQDFYSAYSRLEAAPWTLGTGVPASTVEAALRRQTLLIAGGALLAVLLAAAGAWLLGRRIAGALTRLAEVSRSGGAADGPALDIEEAETARRQLREAMTAQLRARGEAEEARGQAEAANRGKDEFVALLAHELRNPLSAMGTSVALLEAAATATPTQRRAMDALKRQVHQMSRLVEDLLDAARVNSGKFALQLEEVDLAGIVRSVLQAFEDAGRTRHLQVDCSVEPAVVLGDPVRLEQIVANLVDNAAKFTAVRGRIGIRLQCGDGQARLIVQDDGAGITPELLPHLFEPYTQAGTDSPARRAGLGLGLHVVQRLVALHGGRIHAHSEGSGRGARFTVWLPLAAASQPLPPKPA